MNVFQVAVFMMHASLCFGLNYMEIAQTNTRKSGNIDNFNTAGLYFCAKQCKQTKNCFSFNFHREELVCELVGESGELSNSVGWIHIDDADNVQENGYTLPSNACSQNQRQYILSSGNIKCYPFGNIVQTKVCPTDEGYVYNPSMSFCYKRYSDGRNYYAAFNVCKNDKGYLVKIDSQERQTEMENYLEGFGDPYVRIQADRINNNWVYDDGSPMIYFNWNSNEPGSQEQIIMSRTDGYRWLDSMTIFGHAFVCEIPL